jgi:L-threonylcarbamoyladenylate synthase
VSNDSPGTRATLIRADAESVDDALLEAPAQALAGGELVAFPTETVYGLGANALDEAAVRRIFEAKGRPATNPLIVHIADLGDVARVVSNFPPLARRLAEAFWPGPLTLILGRKNTVSEAVSAGLETVAVRMPAHPVARALIRLAGVPVAAPSANRYTEVSPTTAAHVLAGLGDAIEFVVDGGPTQVGLESTVLSLVDGRPEILRPGMITRAQIAEIAPEVVYAGTAPVDEALSRPSPGLARKHYSPRATLKIVAEPSEALRTLGDQPDTAFVLLDAPSKASERKIAGPVEVLGREPAAYAQGLYRVLHDLDRRGCTTIIVERPPDGEAWRAIHDRLGRAESR